jgi:hypothetical protein
MARISNKFTIFSNEDSQGQSFQSSRLLRTYPELLMLQKAMEPAHLRSDCLSFYVGRLTSARNERNRTELCRVSN